MKVRKDLIYIAVAENVSEYFGEHGTVVEENFETARPQRCSGCLIQEFLLPRGPGTAVGLSALDAVTRMEERELER